MTANAMQGDRELCLDAGMDDYVSKPIRPAGLVGALARIRSRAEAASPKAADVRLSGIGSGPRWLDAEDVGPPRSSGSKDGVLDPAALEQLLAVVGDEAALAELTQSFLDEAPELLSSLKIAAATGDAGAVRRIAHTLKGSARDFGAAELAHWCEELEMRAKAGDLSSAEGDTTRVVALYQPVREALEGLIANSRSARQPERTDA